MEIKKIIKSCENCKNKIWLEFHGHGIGIYVHHCKYYVCAVPMFYLCDHFHEQLEDENGLS